MVQNDDEAWRAIVDNYGDRPDLEDPPEAAADAPTASSDPTPEDLPGRGYGGPDELDRPDQDEAPFHAEWEEDRFVPPPPPPIPQTTTDRKAAWFGIFGSPAILLVSLVLGIRLPELISYLLVAGFIGGFVYLVLKMNPEPRDPDDNGAVL